MNLRNLDPRVAMKTLPHPISYSGITRADASLLRRLRSDGAFTRTVLHRIPGAQDRRCDLCDCSENIYHILLEYQAYREAREGFRFSFRLAGRPDSAGNDILFF